MARWLSQEKLPLWKKIAYTVLILISAYVFSIVWRVSVAEQHYFGRSELIPLSLNRPGFSDKAVKGSYESKTFLFSRQGKPIRVWRQEINGFQHVYGSALAAYELGEKPADWMFCANEYMEAYLDPDGITEKDFKDRRKDLAHNRLGRRIGLQVRGAGKVGSAAEDAILQAVLKEVESKKHFYPHYNDSRILRLESENELGCPGLPSKSFRDMLLGKPS